MPDPNYDTLLADNKALHDELALLKQKITDKEEDIKAVIKFNKDLLASRNNPSETNTKDEDHEKAKKALEEYINK